MSITPAIQSLFEYTAEKVTDRDILAFCPSDPGYPDYCREMTNIRDSRTIPLESNFDITETINLTGWSKPSDYSEPEDFLRFRRFTSSLALGLEHRFAVQGYSSGEIREIYYVSFELLSEVDRNDTEHIRLLSLACWDAREAWARNLYDVIDEETADPDDEFVFQRIDDACVFYTFGMMFLAQISGDWEQSEQHATQLITDIHEGEYPTDPVQRPLLRDHDPVGYPTLYRDWDSLFGELTNPTKHPDTQFVIDGLQRGTG